MKIIRKLRLHQVRNALAAHSPWMLAVVMLCGVSLASNARAATRATITTLHAFAGAPNDGRSPANALLRDRAGNLYGITGLGGTQQNGNVFKVSPDGRTSQLWSFTEDFTQFDHVGPLIMDAAGNLYGESSSGGDSAADHGGRLFKLARTGNGSYAFKVLHVFGATPTDGLNPFGSLVMDKAGDLYGVTGGGGALGNGTVYELTTDGAERVLHSFAQGAGPITGLLMNRAGELVGATGGDASQGVPATMFDMNTAGKIVRNIALPAEPDVGWAADAAGNVYFVGQDRKIWKVMPSGKGETIYGAGSSDFAGISVNPAGTVYALARNGAPSNGSDDFDLSGDDESNAGPPAERDVDFSVPGGTLIEFAPDSGHYTETILGFLHPGDDPETGLTIGPRGTVYGTTDSGGTGSGTVFKATF